LVSGLLNPGGALWQIATLALPLIVAISCHEVAHGWVAWMLGDPTAHRARRLSLNPLRHVDPVGTVLLPGMLALTGLPVFGWAKPVPVDARQLHNPRLGMMAVAVAGPLTNFVLAAIASVALGLMTRYGAPDTTFWKFLGDNLGNFVGINIFLALFNLLPVPPFDGSHVVEGLLPRAAARVYARLRPAGLAVMILLLVVIPHFAPGLGIVRNLVLPPVEWAGAHYEALTQRVAGT
jgi:Zn-dependent protease